MDIQLDSSTTGTVCSRTPSYDSCETTLEEAFNKSWDARLVDDLGQHIYATVTNRTPLKLEGQDYEELVNIAERSELKVGHPFNYLGATQ